MITYQPTLDLEPEPLPEPSPTLSQDRKEYMLMWFDDSKLPLQEKIIRAASYYYQKFGRKPNICEIHTNTQPPTDWRVLAENGILIRFDNRVLVNHLYIGQEEVRP